MKPYPFSYRVPRSRTEALDLLRAHGADAKVLAGGQSLMPMMNFRLLRPAVLVDINRVPDLSGVEELPGGLRIGATTRHVELETSAVVRRRFPVISHAMTHIAHLAIRNRGTIGGSLSHADPAAELPMLMRLLDARLTIVSASGSRTLDAERFFVSALTTALAGDELLTAIDLPFLPGNCGWGFEEFSRRHGDYAVAAVAVTLRAESGGARDVRIALTGVGDVPVRARAAERALDGRAWDEEAKRAVVASVRENISPNADLNGSADYRRYLAGVLTGRAVASAWRRATARS